MFCRNCAKEVDPNAAVCTGCGVPPKQEKKYCSNCANSTEPNQAICLKCGVALASGGGGASLGTGEKQKLVAGILAILLGWLGIHKFYLGYTKEAVIMLVVSIVGSIAFGLGPMAMGIVGIIEGIMYLTKSDEDFQATYVIGRKGWF